MTNLQDKQARPTLEEIGEYVRNPVFSRFCGEIKAAYRCEEKIEYSVCSLAPGWNVKFKKAGKTLCTIYPHEQYFTAMVVVGRKEKAAAEALLPSCAPGLQELYRETREWNGQRWLMIGLEDEGPLYRDALRLIRLRRSPL